jgi:hypothetical protein
MAKTKIQKYKIETVNRKDIKGADYNPRTMDEKTKKRLKSVLKDHGLVMPLVYNKTTGNLVAGHQRLEQIDSIEKTDDYELDVATLEVDEATEKKINILLNNNSLMGDYDFDILADLIQENEIELPSLGFTLDDMNFLEAETGIALQPEEEVKIETMTEEEKAQKEAEKLAKKDAQYHKSMEKRKQHTQESMEQAADDQQAFFVVRFESNEEKQSVLDRIGLDPNTRIILPSVFLGLLKDEYKS